MRRTTGSTSSRSGSFCLEGVKNLNKWIRQIHRWLSIAFTVTVIANIFELTTGDRKSPDWITYSPLLPLALLLVTGLYLFVLPYVMRRRG